MRGEHIASAHKDPIRHRAGAWQKGKRPMFKLEKSVEIVAPVEVVFAYIVDPAHHPEWDRAVDEVKDIQRRPDGRSSYTTVKRLLGLHIDFTEEQAEVIHNERLVLTTHAAGMDATTTFRFERLEGSKTNVSLLSELTLHGPGPLARFSESVVAKYVDHGFEMGLMAVKAHIEAETRTAAPRT